MNDKIENFFTLRFNNAKLILNKMKNKKDVIQKIFFLKEEILKCPTRAELMILLANNNQLLNEAKTLGIDISSIEKLIVEKFDDLKPKSILEKENNQENTILDTTKYVRDEIEKISNKRMMREDVKTRLAIMEKVSRRELLTDEE